MRICNIFCKESFSWKLETKSTQSKVISDAQAVADALKIYRIKIVAKAGGEKLFGSITNIDIAAVLAKGGQVIDRKFITSGIVKRTGKYSASVRLHRDVIIDCLTKL
jgi:large subunit ribosomal protein L9